jgi:hypothetical protein
MSITNAFISGNKALSTELYLEGGGGAIAVTGEDNSNPAHPRLENIIAINNQSIWGGAVYMDNTELLILNAIVSGNTSIDSGGDQHGFGAGIYMRYWHPVIVNALVSGNKLEASGVLTGGAGGAGIKVHEGELTLINSTVSGNFVTYNGTRCPGGGIMVAPGSENQPAVLRVYNSIVLGNTGDGVAATNDVATTSNTTTIHAYNSLFGGWTKAQMDATADGGTGNNADGTDYGTAAGDARLDNLRRFFERFNDIPNDGNTGKDHAGEWNHNDDDNRDFHLNVGSSDVINGGNGSYLAEGFEGLPYQIAEDVDGDLRIREGAPDMGVYESLWTSMTGEGK